MSNFTRIVKKTGKVLKISCARCNIVKFFSFSFPLREHFCCTLPAHLCTVVFVVGTIEDCIREVQNVVGFLKCDRGRLLCLLLLWGAKEKWNVQFHFQLPPPPLCTFYFAPHCCGSELSNIAILYCTITKPINLRKVFAIIGTRPRLH